MSWVTGTNNYIPAIISLPFLDLDLELDLGEDGVCIDIPV